MAADEVVIVRTIDAPLVSIEGFNRVVFEGQFHLVHEFRPRPTAAPRLVAYLNEQYIEIAPITIAEFLAQELGSQADRTILQLWDQNQQLEDQAAQTQLAFDRLRLTYTEEIGLLKKELASVSSNHSSLESVAGEVKDLRSQLSSSTSTIVHLEAENLALKKEIETLKSALKAAQHPPASSVTAPSSAGAAQGSSPHQLQPSNPSPSGASAGAKKAPALIPPPSASAMLRPSTSTLSLKPATTTGAGAGVTTATEIARIPPPASVFAARVKAACKPRNVADESGMRMVKLVVVGDNSTLKTKLCINMTLPYAKPGEYIPTVFDNYSANINYQGYTYNIGLWDTAGQEEYERLRPLAYPNTDIFIVGFRLYHDVTFANVVNTWLPELEHNCPQVPIVLWATWNDEEQSSGNPRVPEETIFRLMESLPSIRGFHIIHEKDIPGSYQLMTSCLEKAIVTWQLPKAKTFVLEPANEKDKDKKKKKK